MTFYPKNLRSVKALKQEKKRQIAKRDKLTGGKEGLGDFTGMLVGDNVYIKLLADVVASRIKKKKEQKKPAAKTEQPKEEQTRKSLLVRVLLDIVYGYAKWKAIELTFKAIRQLWAARSEKKQEG